jgi:hypothetical protein
MLFSKQNPVPSHMKAAHALKFCYFKVRFLCYSLNKTYVYQADLSFSSPYYGPLCIPLPSLHATYIWAGIVQSVYPLATVGRSEIEYRWGRDFPRLSRPARGPTQPPSKLVTGLLPGSKAAGHGVDHTPIQFKG